MNVRRLGVALLILAGLFRAGVTLAQAPAPVRPNIVFLLADDLGWSNLACYGADLHRTRTSIGWRTKACGSPRRMRCRSARRRARRC